MRRLIFVFCLLPTMALADTGGAGKFEVQGVPLIGWSNFNGLGVGIDSKFRYGLDSHWQLESGFAYYTRKTYSTRDFSIGVNYNFSEDWSRSWFMGAGIGLTDGEYVNDVGRIKNNTRAFTYLNAGRRFRLTDSGSITWNPYVELSAAEGGTPATISIMPLSFAYSF